MPAGSPVAEKAGLSPGTASVYLNGLVFRHEPTVVVSVRGLGMTTGAATVHLIAAVPKAPVASVALTVDVNPPSLGGRPVMAPVVALILRPGGSEGAVQVSFWPVAASVPLRATLTATPGRTTFLAGAVTTILFSGPTSQVKPCVSLDPVESVAVIVTGWAPGAVGLPVMVPVVLAIASPVGSPVAVQVRGRAALSVAMAGRSTEAP